MLLHAQLTAAWTLRRGATAKRARTRGNRALVSTTNRRYQRATHGGKALGSSNSDSNGLNKGATVNAE